MNADYGLIYKGTFFDGAVRVPMLIRTPETVRRKDGGKVSEALIEWFDIGPTLVELAGGKLAHQQFAKSLLPMAADAADATRQFAISELREETLIMNDDWKMTLNAKDQPYLLFNIALDAARKGGTYPAALCAADDVAVNLFLDHRLGFLEIPNLVQRVLDEHTPGSESSLDDLQEASSWARRRAEELAGT